jgi:hypothetical protein
MSEQTRKTLKKYIPVDETEEDSSEDCDDFISEYEENTAINGAKKTARLA